MNIEELSKKLDPKNVKQHPYTKMDYIEGWHAIAEANRIFGFDGWNRETLYNKEVAKYQVKIGQRQYQKDGWKVCYEAKVKVTVYHDGVMCVREGTGHGTGSKTDLADAIEGAAKEAETDAMKRALMTFGNPFGLALYDKTKANVGNDDEKEDKTDGDNKGIYIEYGADDVPAADWLEEKLKRAQEYVNGARPTSAGFAKAKEKLEADPIYGQLDVNQIAVYTRTWEKLEEKLKEKGV